MSTYGLVTSSAKLIPTQSRYKESDERKVKHNQENMPLYVYNIQKVADQSFNHTFLDSDASAGAAAA